MRLALLLFVLLSCLPAQAHQPWCEFADLTAARPWQVPDATISYAYFGNVYPAGDVDYFRFEAEAGQSVLLSLSIPAIPDADIFSPLLAVFGPGVEGDLPADAPLSRPVNHGAMLLPLGDAPVHWFEPFSRRWFWNWDDYFFRAPQTAAYTVALWHPQLEIGRYSFVIGQREVFGGQPDCFASFGAYWTPLQPGENPYRDTSTEMLSVSHSPGLTYEMPAATAPRVQLELTPLVYGGYNLRVQTENFRFTPQNIDTAPVAGEGHAHLYLDGVKIARLYGEWFFIEALPADAATLSVTLYANDHSAFAADGERVSASVALEDILGADA